MLEAVSFDSIPKKVRVKKNYATPTLHDFYESDMKAARVVFAGKDNRTVYNALKKANERKRFNIDIITVGGETYLIKKE